MLPEEAVRTRSTTVVNVTLEGSEWAAGLGVDDATTQFWLSRTLNTPSTQLLGWQAVARSRVSVHRATPYTLSLQLGWFAEYDIAWLDEEVFVSVPYWATAINVTAEPSFANFTVAVSTPRARASGELVGERVPEAALRSRQHEVMIELEGCDWPVDAGTPGSAAYAALADALEGPSAGGVAPGMSGWTMAGNGRLVPRRHNASHLTLVVPALAAYDIAAPETVEVTVPAAALLQHHLPLRGVASFVVVPESGAARLGGSLLARNGTRRGLPPRLAGTQLEVSLVADSFAPELRHNSSLQRQLLRGVASAQHERLGWNRLIDAALTPPENVSVASWGTGNLSVELLDERTLVLSLPPTVTDGAGGALAALAFSPGDVPILAYEITAPETLTVDVPAAALVSAAAPLRASPHVRLDAAAGRAWLAGSLLADRQPDGVRNATTHFTLTLELPGLHGAHGSGEGTTALADPDPLDDDDEELEAVAVPVQLQPGGASPLAWNPALATDDGVPTRALIDRLISALLRINDTSYDVFDPVLDARRPNGERCYNLTAPPPKNATNDTNVTNATNATNATLNVSNETAAPPPPPPLLINVTLNATNRSNGTNATNGTDFCESLRNYTNDGVNGSTVWSAPYTPYCDPCLVARRVVPRPFNSTSIALLNNFTLFVTIPAAAEVLTTVANLSVPWEALVRLVTVGDDMDTVTVVPAAEADEHTREIELLRHFDMVPVRVGATFGHSDESSLRQDSAVYTLDIYLEDDTWVHNLTGPVLDAGVPSGVGLELLAGISSAQSEATGWNSIVRPALMARDGSLIRHDDRWVRVLLSGFAQYDILAAESVFVTVPASAVASQQPLVARPAAGQFIDGRGYVESIMGGRDHLVISPTAGRVVLSGSCDGVREEQIRSLAECEVHTTAHTQQQLAPPHTRSNSLHHRTHAAAASQHASDPTLVGLTRRDRDRLLLDTGARRAGRRQLGQQPGGAAGGHGARRGAPRGGAAAGGVGQGERRRARREGAHGARLGARRDHRLAARVVRHPLRRGGAAHRPRRRRRERRRARLQLDAAHQPHRRHRAPLGHAAREPRRGCAARLVDGRRPRHHLHRLLLLRHRRHLRHHLRLARLVVVDADGADDHAERRFLRPLPRVQRLQRHRRQRNLRQRVPRQRHAGRGGGGGRARRRLAHQVHRLGRVVVGRAVGLERHRAAGDLAKRRRAALVVRGAADRLPGRALRHRRARDRRGRARRRAALVAGNLIPPFPPTARPSASQWTVV